MKLDPKLNVWFTGFMATGKSRVGSIVAERLGRHFVDTDRLIEERAGRSVSEIFTQDGEAAFRAIEKETIFELAQQEGLVISLGGGSLTIAEVPPVIHQSGLLVCLWAKPEVLSERIGRKNTRPLLANLDPDSRKTKITELLDDRERYYESADFSIESTDQYTVEHVAERVLAGLRVWSRRAVEVRTSGGDRYPIIIGSNWLNDFDALLEGLKLSPGHEFLAVTDTNVKQHQNHNLQKITGFAGQCPTFIFPPGESQKSLNILNRLYTFMLRRAFGRKTCLLQFGGGVVGDMAGFGAATYQRGIPFIQIPTTLLSMVDSSVGGKVAVNHPEGKNMIGAFYQPRAVAIDLSVLETLPREEFLSGLGEIVKYGVIYDSEFFRYLELHVDAILARNTEVLAYLVCRSCEIKAEVVGQDEKETGIRAILNYGHTFGHAIEKLTDYSQFSHGLTVGLGMRVAARLSVLTGRWTPAEETRQNFLLNRLGIPKYFAVDPAEAWKAMAVDKKVEKSKRVYILATRIGVVEKASDVPESLVHQAWDTLRPSGGAH
jgi:shikimate kinase/3-dehydroquinate synthase